MGHDAIKERVISLLRESMPEGSADERPAADGDAKFCFKFHINAPEVTILNGFLNKNNDNEEE